MEQQEKAQRFTALVKEYRRVIYKICYMYATDSEEFKDLYQEVLVRLWRGFDAYEGRGKPSSWIYRVGLNTCVSYYRRERSRGERVSLDALCGAEAEDGETARRLHEMYRMIAGLGKLERAIVLLWLDERPYDEIAEIIGMPRNTVATRLRRIKEKLTKQANG